MPSGSRPGFLNDLSVTWKMALSTGLILLLLLAAAQVGLTEMPRLRALSDGYHLAAERAIVVADLQEDMLEARLAANKFRATGEAEHVEAVLANIGEIRGLVDVSAGTVLTDPDRIDAVRRLARTAERYGETLARAASLAPAERRAVFARDLDVTGPEIVEALDGIAAAVREDSRSARAAYDRRADALQERTFALAIGAVVLGLLVALVQIAMIRRPIRAITHRLSELAEGTTDFVVREKNSRDEFGRMWDALATLRGSVRKAYTRAQMIEELPVPVVVADPAAGLAVTYANQSATRSLHALAPHLPVAPDAVEGRPLDSVFRSAELDRHALGNAARLPRRATVDLGGAEFLDVSASAVHDRGGAHVGTMVSWTVITAEVEGRREFETGVKTSFDEISRSFEDMRERIGAIAESAEKTQAQLSSGASAVTRASGNVQMVASAAEELASSIAEIADNLGVSSERARQASGETGEVAAKAETLAQASERIGSVVDTIAEIANQTNLLALNATIEAARAGEAGKGFAVVAEEVKKLAQQTERATEEVKGETAAVVTQIESVVGGIRSVAAVIEEITNLFASIATAAEEQQAATREITENAQCAAGEADTAARSITEVERLASDNLGAASALAGAADQISAANENLSRRSDAFLKVLGAA